MEVLLILSLSDAQLRASHQLARWAGKFNWLNNQYWFILGFVSALSGLSWRYWVDRALVAEPAYAPVHGWLLGGFWTACSLSLLLGVTYRRFSRITPLELNASRQSAAKDLAERSPRARKYRDGVVASGRSLCEMDLSHMRLLHYAERDRVNKQALRAEWGGIGSEYATGLFRRLSRGFQQRVFALVGTLLVAVMASPILLAKLGSYTSLEAVMLSLAVWGPVTTLFSIGVWQGARSMDQARPVWFRNLAIAERIEKLKTNNRAGLAHLQTALLSRGYVSVHDVGAAEKLDR